MNIKNRHFLPVCPLNIRISGTKRLLINCRYRKMKYNIRILSIVLILAILCLIFGFSWRNWQNNGTVITESYSSEIHGCSKIIVREIPTRKSPIWMLIRDHIYYRCEFYFPEGNAEPWTSETFSLDSYVATKVRGEWHNETEATVHFDTMPALDCDNGIWRKHKKQQPNNRRSLHD